MALYLYTTYFFYISIVNEVFAKKGKTCIDWKTFFWNFVVNTMAGCSLFVLIQKSLRSYFSEILPKNRKERERGTVARVRFNSLLNSGWPSQLQTSRSQCSIFQSVDRHLGSCRSSDDLAVSQSDFACKLQIDLSWKCRFSVCANLQSYKRFSSSTKTRQSKGNSALTERHVAAPRGWMPLAYSKENVFFHIFYYYYDYGNNFWPFPNFKKSRIIIQDFHLRKVTFRSLYPKRLDQKSR